MIISYKGYSPPKCSYNDQTNQYTPSENVYMNVVCHAWNIFMPISRVTHRFPYTLPMPSMTTVTGGTNDTHIPIPYRLTSTQCKCRWATNPESISTPITQLEVYVITMTVSLLWATELFGSHRRSLTPMLQNFSDHTAGLLHPCSRLFT